MQTVNIIAFYLLANLNMIFIITTLKRCAGYIPQEACVQFVFSFCHVQN